MSTPDNASGENLKYLAALNHFLGFGPARIRKIKKHFPSAKDAFSAPLAELLRAGIEEFVAREFVAARGAIDPEKIWEELGREGIRTVALEDEAYPKLLKEIYDPPPLLYWRGNLRNDGNELSLGVVGTRKITAYGKRVAEDMVRGLVGSGLAIVSGLAYGIDTVAHHATLACGGRTIAVLGSGLDKKSVYPSQNRYLADKIADSGGLILSEFPLHTPPLKHNFPQRNRIISGLSLGVLVVEAGEKSGALITARFALEQNREVFAVPGSLYSSVSLGPNNLIKEGARTVTGAADIIEALNIPRLVSCVENRKILPASKEEELIASALAHEPMHADELVRLTGLDTSRINSTLLIMEMKGMIKNLGGMEYAISQ